MTIDFGKIARPKAAKRPVDPIELFQSAKVTDAAINDLWLAQGDALRQWHIARTAGDVAVVLDTGAGKTLVGLLAAQSLVNETNGKVLYACGSIQLVAQTAAKARGYGIDVTTYVQRRFSNDLYQRGLAPCITTYQALLNGRSRFFGDELDALVAVVFDDAHTAEQHLREQFTLRIDRATFPDVFSQIAQLYRDYHTRIGVDVGYQETQQRADAARSWFVPPFAMRERLAELRQILGAAKLGETTQTMFAWEYLKDRIDLAAVFISGREVALTPPVVPTRALPYFRAGVRRLYLSATLTAQDAFLRTFGKVPDAIIAPDTTAGKCERMILLPKLHAWTDDDVREAKRVIAPYKALILVPSNARKAQWTDIATIEGDDATERIEEFKRATTPEKLLLANRYDGVDLPGDACRVMVIDDLSSSVGPLERFLWEQLGLNKSLRSTVASRIVQSFGRISRGMSDHGVVLLTGDKLINWLLLPKNRAALPSFLRRQLDLGISVSQGLTDPAQFAQAARQCLTRDANWVTNYQDVMDEPGEVVDAGDSADMLAIARAEVEFGHRLWERDYATAAKRLEASLEQTFGASQHSGAWHALWLGYCYELLGDSPAARLLYRRAHRAARNIPPFDLHSTLTRGDLVPEQVRNVAGYVSDGTRLRREALGRFDTGVAALDGTGSVRQTEEAVRSLGEFLGLRATRPDNEEGTGPDVLWMIDDGTALCMELKTDKGASPCYRKDELGQLRDHVQWVRDNTPTTAILPAFVGPLLPASGDANPGPEIDIIELAELRAIASQLRAALEEVFTVAVPANVEQAALEVLTRTGLLWPRLCASMSRHSLAGIASP